MTAVPPSKAPDTSLKAACLRAAREAIAEHGLEQLSLRDVARRLGVSHQAPYRHFPSRDHLLAEVIRQCFEDFAASLDAREPQPTPDDDLQCLGTRYLQYALAHPLEYRLMFGTPWPEPAEEVGLVRDALHAFNILREDLRAVHGQGPEMQAKVDLDAMMIWSGMHGLSSILQSSAVRHLDLSVNIQDEVPAHIMSRLRAMLVPPVKLP